MKAQSALEYLMIVGITLMIILPTTYLFYSYSRQLTEETVYPQVNDIGLGIIKNAESVYYSGEHSKIVMEVSMPDKIDDFYILYNRELVFDIGTDLGSNEMVFFSQINITSDSCIAEKCSLSDVASSGLKKIKIESIEGGKQVLISKAE
jgi:hypothetical protein